MKKILIGICAVLVLAAVALAQPGHRGGGPHGKMRGDMMEAHFAALNLTEEQKAAAKQLHEELRTKAEPLMEQAHEQWEAVHELLDSDNPNPTEVGTRAIAAHQTRAQLKALHDEFKTRFTALLTAEQRTKLEKFHERHEDGGEGRHRFRGFGHGPGF